MAFIRKQHNVQIMISLRGYTFLMGCFAEGNHDAGDEKFLCFLLFFAAVCFFSTVRVGNSRATNGTYIQYIATITIAFMIYGTYYHHYIHTTLFSDIDKPMMILLDVFLRCQFVCSLYVLQAKPPQKYPSLRACLLLRLLDDIRPTWLFISQTRISSI
jgi:hypothetical protein